MAIFGGRSGPKFRKFGAAEKTFLDCGRKEGDPGTGWAVGFLLPRCAVKLSKIPKYDDECINLPFLCQKRP